MKHCRNEHEIAIVKVGNNVPNPIIRFGDGGLPDVMSEIHKAGFAAPTPIQSQGFALALTGQDMVGIARTGSGKTLGTLSLALFTAISCSFLQCFISYHVHYNKLDWNFYHKSSGSWNG